MHAALFLLFIATMVFEPLAKAGWLPSFAPYVQEILALIAALYVLTVGVQTRFRYVRPEYWLAFGALLFVILCGVAINALSAGPLFAGIRSYLRAMPLFFLPAVLAIDDRKLRKQLLLLLALALLQFPLALYQRTTMWAKGHISGDWVVGTLNSSSILSVFLVCAACVLAGMYLRKRIRLGTFLFLLLLILAPTALNETKATLILVPIGLLAVFVVGARRGTRFPRAIAALAVLSVFAAAFIPVYDHYVKPRWGYGIVEFFTMEGRLEGYLSRDSRLGVRKAGKLDGITVPLRELARDPTQLAFGLGIGNASDSALGEQFTGDYYRRFEPFIQSAASTLILEIGALGFLLVLLIYFLILRDAQALARGDPGLTGALGVGWIGVVVVMAISTFYAETTGSGALAFLFWYGSGVIAAQRMRLAEHAVSPALHRARA